MFPFLSKTSLRSFTFHIFLNHNSFIVAKQQGHGYTIFSVLHLQHRDASWCCMLSASRCSCCRMSHISPPSSPSLCGTFGPNLDLSQCHSTPQPPVQPLWQEVLRVLKLKTPASLDSMANHWNTLQKLRNKSVTICGQQEGFGSTLGQRDIKQGQQKQQPK